jgi:hypothetical protein
VGRAGLTDRRLHRDHDLVVVTVVAALDLDDLLSAGDATSDANGVHRGLGSGVGEAPHRQPVAVAQQFGDISVGLARCDEQRAVVELSLDGATHGRMTVTREQRPVAHVEVDVAVPVDIFHPGLLRPAHHDRVRVVGLEAAGDTHRQYLAGTLSGRLRPARSVHVHAEFTCGDQLGPFGEFTRGNAFRRAHDVVLRIPFSGAYLTMESVVNTWCREWCNSPPVERPTDARPGISWWNSSQDVAHCWPSWWP